MPTKRKRVPVAFDDKAVVALGLDPDIEGEVSSAALAGAVARYADLMYVAAADLDRLWRRAQWAFVAECLRRTKFPAFAPTDHTAHLAVIEAIEEAHAAKRLGEMHFIDAIEAAKLTHAAARKRADERVAALCQQLRALTPVHGAAVLAAVRWYWAHEAELKGAKDEWWLPHARNKSFNSRKPAPKTKAGDAPGQPTLFPDDPEE